MIRWNDGSGISKINKISKIGIRRIKINKKKK